jgi:hypothetical protein
MEKSRPAADRVRPILQAMERSIDAARRRRLHAGAVEEEDAPAPAVPDTSQPLRIGEPGARLKARPKRPSAFPRRDDGSHIPQAG